VDELLEEIRSHDAGLLADFRRSSAGIGLTIVMIVDVWRLSCRGW
jgi:hypothetical protein